MNNNTYYQLKINKALDYINQHLSESIAINDVAKAATFSEFHFQRIFKSMQGESPYECISRLRLEKAIFLIKNHPHLTIGHIATECGFPSPENFSRQFKARFNISPSKLKKDKELQNSRMYQVEDYFDFYSCIDRETSRTFEVEIEDLDEIPIAFIRAIFGADGNELLSQYHVLMEWADTNGINYKGSLKRFGMSIDNPDVTPPDKYRYDFALTNRDAAIPLSGAIERGTFPRGKYATIHCKGKLQDVSEAWDYLYKVWLPSSHFVPRHYPAIEEFVQGPEEIGWENFNIKCRIPITKI